MYCIIPKAASTNWKRVLVRSYSNRTIGKGDLFRTALSDKYGLRSLAEFSKAEIQERLKTYFKFLVVSHPLKRIVSAYFNKFEPYGNLSDVHISFKGYLPFIQRQNYGKSSVIAFSDFVEYIISVYNISTSYFSRQRHGKPDHNIVDETKLRLKVRFAISQWLNRDHVLYKGSEYFNRHWAQYSTLCHPCHIDYDYIVKFETMREDATYVLSKLGPHHECLEEKYPELFNYSQSTSSVYDSQFSQLTPLQISRLKEIYSIDLKLFGYES